MNIHRISYRKAAFGYGKPSVLLVKAVFPLSAMMVNLPCLKGSSSQLPSSHLFIHRVPAKLLGGVSAPWCKFLPATALVCRFEFPNPPLVFVGAESFSGR